MDYLSFSGSTQRCARSLFRGELIALVCATTICLAHGVDHKKRGGTLQDDFPFQGAARDRPPGEDTRAPASQQASIDLRA